MKIAIQRTRATLQRRTELRNKILALLDEYHDVPILVAHRVNFSGSNDNPMFDFKTGQDNKQVHLIVKCQWEGKNA